jgi:hypothetical protein
MLTAVAVKNLLPASVESWSEKKIEKYHEKISQQKQSVMSSMKVKWDVLIDEVREWPLFGCSYFTCKVVSDPNDVKQQKEAADLPKGLMMGISSQGLFLVSGKEKKIHRSYEFFRITGFAMDGNDIISVTARDEKDKKKPPSTHKFRTPEVQTHTPPPHSTRHTRLSRAPLSFFGP